MPIGEHKGKPVDEIPTEYLQWFIDSVDGFSDVKSDAAIVILESKASSQKMEKPRAKKQKSGKPKKSVYAIMPIGQFKGRPIDKVPRWFLEWFIAKVEGWNAERMDAERFLEGKPPLPKHERKRIKRRESREWQEAKSLDDEFRNIVG